MIAEEIGKREPPGRESLRNDDFAQRASRHIVGIPAHLKLLGKKRILPDTQNLVCNVLVDVAKDMEPQVRRIKPGFRRESPAKFFIADRHQAALRVLNYANRASSQQLRGKNQRTNRVVGDNATGVSNHVRIADAQSEQLFEVHARIHAGENHQFLDGRCLQVAKIKTLCVSLIVLHQIVEHGFGWAWCGLRHDQYLGTLGSTSSDQARIPPLRLWILRKPALRKKSTASAERFPLRQWATISRDESSSWTRRVSSPSGSRCPLRLQIWYSWGSRTSRMNKSSPRSSLALSSRGVISGTCTVGPGASSPRTPQNS